MELLLVCAVAAEPAASTAVRLAVTGRHSGCSLRSMENDGQCYLKGT